MELIERADAGSERRDPDVGNERVSLTGFTERVGPAFCLTQSVVVVVVVVFKLARACVRK